MVQLVADMHTCLVEPPALYLEEYTAISTGRVHGFEKLIGLDPRIALGGRDVENLAAAEVGAPGLDAHHE
jgi:hypothetical protein